MARTKYKDEDIVDAVTNSYSLLEVIRKLGASITSGSTRNIIRKRINNLRLNIDHFKNGTTISSENTKMKYQDILVYDRRKGLRERVYILRRALFESGVKEICGCGQGTIWQNQSLQLEIDHIDENPLNNVKDNLRFICPNCHSQKHVNNKRGNTAKMAD